MRLLLLNLKSLYILKMRFIQILSGKVIEEKEQFMNSKKTMVCLKTGKIDERLLKKLGIKPKYK